MDSKFKKFIPPVIGVLVCALLFSVYWFATKTDRDRKELMTEISEELAENYSDSSPSLYFYYDDVWNTDTEFNDFLVIQVQDLINNKKSMLLLEFLENLEDQDTFNSEIVSLITNTSTTTADIEFLLDIFDYLPYNELKYYNQCFVFNRNSGMLGQYISQNGTKPITYTEGEGYYADSEPKSEKNVIGIPTSPLYDAKSISYFGDFKCVNEYGVKLDQYYQEKSYSNSSYYFRGAYMHNFTPYDGECVWSGTYLFCFAPDGTLLNFADNIKS